MRVSEEQEERGVIERSEYPNTFESIRTGLKSIGLTNGDVVIVHSSLSKIG